MKLLRSAITFSSLFCMVGCVQVVTKVTPLSANHYPEKPSDSALPVLSQFPTDRKYEEICIIESKKYIGSLNDMLPTIRAEACKVGADAIVVKSSSTSAGETWAQAHVVAIKFI